MANITSPKRDLKKSTIKFIDGTAITPNEITIKLDDGNITVQHGKNFEYILDRGVLDAVREGDQIPLSLTVTGRFNEIRSSTGTDISPYEFATKTGNGSSLVSTGALCDPYCIDVEITTSYPDCDDGTDEVQDETETYPEFRADTIDIDMDAGTITFTGRCNVVHPTVARTAQV